MRKLPRRLVALAVLVTAASSLTAQQTTAPQLATAAAEALERGQYFQAVEGYREAVALNPNYLDAIIGLAESYYWLGEYDQAALFVDRARRLARTNPRVINLAGRIAIGRGDLEAAEAAFARVQELEPNNVDAAIGRAELALARGRSGEAAASLERALRLNPEHRKALLSLVLVYEYLGEDQIARDYLELARSVHRERPEVHVLAAEYFLRSGDFAEAGRAARTASAIDPSNRAASGIRARVAVAEESYVEAVATAEELIAGDRSDVFAWYVRALAKYRLGEIDDALVSVRTALRVEPDDEALRLWAEWIATAELELDHPVRSELAAKRADDAATLERAFRYERAQNAYRRALRLTPLDLDLRRAYADLFRKMGYHASYLQELSVLRENGVDTSEIRRIFEVYENSLASSVSNRWGIDQFTLSRTRVPIGLYLDTSSTLAYPDSLPAVLAFARRTLEGSERMEIVDDAVVSGYGEAFAAARAAGVGFYVTARAGLTDRITAVVADVVVARTGTHAVATSAVRTGPGHTAAAVDAFAADIQAALPVQGRIIRREGSRVVIDLGARDGVAREQVFDVVRPGDLSIAPTETRLVYRDSSVIATVTVTRVDDLVAEGRLDTLGIGDLVTVGDAIVPRQPPTEEEEEAEPTGDERGAPVDLFPVLYERVRRLR